MPPGPWRGQCLSELCWAFLSEIPLEEVEAKAMGMQMLTAPAARWWSLGDVSAGTPLSQSLDMLIRVKSSEEVEFEPKPRA